MDLLDGERVIAQTTLHGIVFLPSFVWLVVAGFFISQHSVLILLGWLLAFIALASFITTGISFKTSKYVLTNKRLLVKQGFFKQQTLSLLLARIEGVQVSQGVWGRLLNFGTLIVYGMGGSSEPFMPLRQPDQFREQIQKQIEQYQQ